PEDDDRMRQAGCSKRERFLEVRDPKELHRTRDCFGYPDQPVPVGVCLYHRENVSPADTFADHAEIVEQRTAIDFSPTTVCVFRAHLLMTDIRAVFGTVMCGA
ncbi:MAG: hypothetical protein QOG51_2214, partial [Verrucomicrobiota bacterium]